MAAIEGRKVDSFCLWSFDGRSLHLFMSSVLGMRKVKWDGWAECIWQKELGTQWRWVVNVRICN